MSDRTTPETDDIARGNHVVPTEWAQQLERERDEARRKLNNLDVTAIHSCHNECQRPICVLRRERDEARDDAAHWKSEWEIVEARLCGWKHPRDNGIIFEHEIIPKLQRERDEALEKLSAAWQSLRDSQDEVLRLTFENRELRNLKNE